jgi:IS30 family transposase
MARRLRRAASTVSREIARHGGRGHYGAEAADRNAWDSALRPKLCLLARNRRPRSLSANVQRKLRTEPFPAIGREI